MTYIPAELRRVVITRAEGRCEYCCYPQAFAFLPFEVEHVIAEKHSGATASNNLAWACPYCNRYKGTDLGSLDPDTGQLTPLFNPRTHVWNEHFQLQGALIVPFVQQLLQPTHEVERTARDNAWARRVGFARLWGVRG